MLKFLKTHWLLVIGLGLLALLLYKNPFSGQNFISNLEPSPDSMHYLSPVKSLLSGQRLRLIYEGRDLSPAVPPLYSLLLVPTYALFGDPRSFYIVNVILAILSSISIYLILRKLFKEKWVQLLLFMSFVTNFIVYWYPVTPMAENLLIFLVLLSINLLLLPWSLAKSTLLKPIALALVAVAMFETKYIAWPISFSLLVVTVIDLLTNKTVKSRFWLIGFYLLALVLFSTFSVTYESYNKNFTPIQLMSAYIKVLTTWWTGSTVTNSGMARTQEISNSNVYFSDNAVRYLAGFIGGPVTAAGSDVIIISTLIGSLGLFGLLLNLWQPRRWLLSWYFFLSFTLTCLFITFFQTTEARYVFSMIPVLILSCGLLLQRWFSLADKWQRPYLIYLTIFFCTISILYSNLGNVGHQLHDNFISDTPAANYQAILFLNQYFAQTSQSQQKPIVVTVMIPYMVDMYSNHRYELLPLSYKQHFTSLFTSVWGPGDYSDLLKLYDRQLKDGRQLYLYSFGTNNFYYTIDYNRILNYFKVEKIMTGCSGSCTLYRIIEPKLGY